MWELTLRGTIRPGLEGTLANEAIADALVRELSHLAGPGQSDYLPALTGTDGGVSAVCEFPGGSVGLDTYCNGRIRVEVAASDAYDSDRVVVAVMNAYPLFNYQLGWAQPA